MNPKPLLLLLSFVCAGFAQDIVAITGATVIDGTGAAPRRATVVVRGGRVAEIGPSVAIPAGARVIKADGKTLTPGLIDMHTHLLASGSEAMAPDWGKILKSYLYSGVTTVLDVGTFCEQLAPMRRLIAEGLPAPKVMMAVRFSTPGGHGAEGGRGDFHTQMVQTPREARTAVQRIVAYKPDMLKIFSDGWRYGTDTDMTSMDQETMSALVAEGHKYGIRSVSHTVTLDKAKLASRAHVDAVIHGLGDAPVDQELISLFRENKTNYAPTLAVYEAHVFPNGAPPLLADLLPPAVAERLTKSLSISAARRSRWANLTSSVKLLKAAGLPVSCGTDAGMTSTFHGWATQHEIELLVASGMTPLEAITAATGVTARSLGIEKDRGTIEVGKAADLLLVDGAPHERLADLMKISRVFLNGVEVDRAALQKAIQTPGPTPMKALSIQPLLDDFEADGGRSRIDTLWVNNTDGGHDHAKMSYQRTLRSPGNHALTILAEMGDKERTFGAMTLPLTRGAVEPVDLSGFRAIEFEARGEGDYALALMRRSVSARRATSFDFKAGAEWRKIRLELPEKIGDATALQFRMEREAGRKTWLELDNLRLVH